MSRADDLVEVLEDLGVEVNKLTGDEVQCRCPVHHKFKGRESARYTFYLNTDSYLFHCFTCGARGSLYQLINELTDDPNQLWRIQSGMIQKGVSRLEPEEDVYEAPVNLDWLKYAEFDRLPQSVINFRNVDPDVALRHGVRWDSDIKAVLTPIVSPLGELRGYQQKKTGWVNNFPQGVHKKDTLFGIERAVNPIGILLESPLDVVRFHSVYGGREFSAVSSFGANVSSDQARLLERTFDTVVLALDNDIAGYKETKRVSKYISPRKGLRYWIYDKDDPKDLGDMTDGQIMDGMRRISSVYRQFA